MSPTHIVVILLQLPLKAITGPVVTASHRVSKISVTAAAGMTAITCSRPDTFQKQPRETGQSWWPNMGDNKGQKLN